MPLNSAKRKSNPWLPDGVKGGWGTMLHHGRLTWQHDHDTCPLVVGRHRLVEFRSFKKRIHLDCYFWLGIWIWVNKGTHLPNGGHFARYDSAICHVHSLSPIYNPRRRPLYVVWLTCLMNGKPKSNFIFITLHVELNFFPPKF